MGKIRKMTVEEEARRAFKRAAAATRRRLIVMKQTALAEARGLTYEEYRSRLAQMEERRRAGNSGPEADRHREYRNSVNGKEAMKRAQARKKEKHLELLIEHKSKPCTDCGGCFHRHAMEFDHRDPSKKSFAIALLRGVRIELAEAEIQKCDLVCANCHRVRGARRREGLPATMPPPEYHI